MRWLLCAWLVALPGIAAAADAHGVLVLSASARASRRESVLVDALRIYTRDLGRTVHLGGAAPTGLEPATLERIAAAARAAGDEIVVWFGARDGVPVLYALRAQKGELREAAVEREDALQTARTLALKVRSLLASRSDDSDWTMLPDALPSLPPSAGAPSPEAPAGDDSTATDAATAAPGPAADAKPPADPTANSNSNAATNGNANANANPPSPPPAPSPTSAPSTAATPVPVPATASLTRAPAAASRRTWLEATVAYSAIVPTQLDWVRHGLTVRLALPALRWLAPYADASFTTEPSVRVDGRTVAGRIWPVAVGVAFRLRRPRWQLAIGPRASLQIVDADARASDGKTGAARRYAAGLGLLGEAAWLFSRHVGLVASISGEALLPRLTFGAGGPGQTDLGWVQAGFSLGLLVSIP